MIGIKRCMLCLCLTLVGALAAEALAQPLPVTRPALSPADEQQLIRAIQCEKNLHDIANAVTAYALAHKNKYPPDLATLAAADHAELSMFICPAASSALPANAATMTAQERVQWVKAHSDYIYCGAGGSVFSPMDAVLAYERDDDHSGIGMNVVFNDGHVEFLLPDEVRRRFGPKVGTERPTRRLAPASGQPPAIPLVTLGQAKTWEATWGMEQISGALDAFELDYGRFPTTAEGIAALITRPVADSKNHKQPYISGIPKDPWDHPYIYRSPGVGGKDFDLFSAGPDGRPDTADDVRLR
jgi:type II secretion system protein G